MSKHIKKKHGTRKLSKTTLKFAERRGICLYEHLDQHGNHWVVIYQMADGKKLVDMIYSFVYDYYSVGFELVFHYNEKLEKIEYLSRETILRDVIEYIYKEGKRC